VASKSLLSSESSKTSQPEEEPEGIGTGGDEEEATPVGASREESTEGEGAVGGGAAEQAASPPRVAPTHDAIQDRIAMPLS
jgi:hypothetical protein